MMNTKAFELGAMLFSPCTLNDLTAIGNGQKFPYARSIIFDLEDSVADGDVERAMRNLEVTLTAFHKAGTPPMRFVRVRNPDIARRVRMMRGVENLDGFVFPKFTRHNFSAYMSVLSEADNLSVIPILETAEIFVDSECVAIRELLAPARYRDRILALMIGGNDLMNCLDIRRSPLRTIYDTPVGTVIDRLVGLFKPFGFQLLGTVFEGLNHVDTLRREVSLDLLRGLCGKLAIHPEQVPIIHDLYAVSPEDHEMAEAILEPGAKAVFSMHGTMCEPATHKRWALTVQARARIFGVSEKRLESEK